MRKTGAGLIVALLPFVTLLAQSQSKTELAARHYETGLDLYRRGNLDAAVTELKKSIAVGSNFPEAYNALGLLLGKKGADIESVLFHFRKALEFRPEYAEAHHNLGLVLAQLGRIEECISEFRAAIDADPKDPEPYNSLALTLVERNVDQAIELYEKAIALKPAFVEAEFNLALAYRRKYGTEREVEQLRKVLELDEDHLVARNTLTRRYEELGQYDEVGRLAAGTLRSYPNSGEAHYFAGKAMLKEGKTAEGFSHLQEAIRLEPTLAEAQYHLSLVLRKQGKQQEADAALARSEEQREKQHRDINASVQMSQAALSIERGEIDKAIAALRDVVKNQPEWPDAHWRLGFALLRADNTDQASFCFRRAIELDANYFEAHYFLGLIELRNGMFQEARAALEKAVHLRGNSAEAHHALGDALALGKSPGLAEAEYRTALRIRPDHPATLHALARVLADQKKLTESRRIQKLAIKLSQTTDTRGQAIAALQEGNLKLHSGDLADAVEWFRKSVSAYPDLPEAQQFLGTALLSSGQLDEAITALTKAIELKPAYFEALYNLGLAHAKKADVDTAIQHFRRALEFRETSAECHDSLGVALATKREYAGAILEFRRAVELKPEWSLAHFHLGSALRLSGDEQAATLAFAEAGRLDPKLTRH